MKIKYAHVKCYYNLCNVCSFQRGIIRVIVRGVRCTILKWGILISISFVCLISARRIGGVFTPIKVDQCQCHMNFVLKKC